MLSDISDSSGWLDESKAPDTAGVQWPSRQGFLHISID